MAHHGIAGVRLGVGFSHRTLAPSLLDAAGRHDLPVFEVPYEVPFIAITERAFAHLVSEQYEALRRSTAIGGRRGRLGCWAAGAGNGWCSRSAAWMRSCGPSPSRSAAAPACSTGAARRSPPAGRWRPPT